jgi:tetratricopeptide (TPR) repeat protein
MTSWTRFAHCGAYPFDANHTRALWSRLHAGDQEPLPQDERVLAAWTLFHSGAFQEAAEAGLQAGPAGLSVANKATCMYANYLEPKERARLELFLKVAERAATQVKDDPADASAHYWHAYALGRHGQAISVAKALAQGVGGRVKNALEAVLRLKPSHAAAHIALGAFHAEVIDKVGPLIANLTYGAKPVTSLDLFQKAMQLTPHSAIVKMEYANALMMLEGDAATARATDLYEQAAAKEPLDAMERLDQELALTLLEA